MWNIEIISLNCIVEMTCQRISNFLYFILGSLTPSKLFEICGMSLENKKIKHITYLGFKGSVLQKIYCSGLPSMMARSNVIIHIK